VLEMVVRTVWTGPTGYYSPVIRVSLLGPIGRSSLNLVVVKRLCRSRLSLRALCGVHVIFPGPPVWWTPG